MARLASLACLLAAASLSPACTVQSSADQSDAGPQNTGGTTQGADAGDEGNTPAGPCGDVPVTGRCVGAANIEVCVIPEGSSPEDTPAPFTSSNECPPGTQCSDTDGLAECKPTGSCVEGESRCKTKYEAQTCVGGDWVLESCGTGECVQEPGMNATCLSSAGGTTGPHLVGKLRYEKRSMKPDRTGFADPEQLDAVGVVAVVYDGNDYLGGAYTQSDGTFDVQLSKDPSADAALFFFPMFFDDNGSVQLAVLKWGQVSGPYDLEASEYWYFSVSSGQSLDVGTVLVGEADGSGAIGIYETLLYGMQTAYSFVPGMAQRSLAALWTPGEVHGCGNSNTGGTACFYGKAHGGVALHYDGGADYFDTAIAIPGTEDSPKHWADAVLLHELGHYMMDNYSRPPGVGGPHALTDKEEPSMAWSEGYATFYGQSTLGHGVYFAKDQGTSWYFDIDHADDNYFDWPMPDPTGPMDQQIGEVFVATTMWHLWSTAATQADEAWDTTGLGDDRAWSAFTSDFLTASYAARGYATPDLVDWLDALRCQCATDAELRVVLDHYGFPYDYAPSCP